MNLLNRSLRAISVALFGIISIWAVIFYLGLLDEIYDSLDDGLDNARLLIIQHAREDSDLLAKNTFDESNYSIREITRSRALEITDSFKDTLMYMQNEDDLEPVRLLTTAFQDGNTYYELKVFSSMVEEDDLIESFLWGLGALYLLLLLAIIIINNILLRKLWKPFYKILQQLKTYRVEKAQKPEVVETNVTEFAELKTAADELFERTLTTFRSQKQFTENAAHELQTPLATSINKLELLLERNKFSDAQAAEVAQVIALLERLTRFNRSLLLLSRIENKQYIENERISINSIVKQAVENMRDFADHKMLTVTIDEKAELSVTMNRELGNILISNLVKNAVVHNITNGKIEVEIRDRSLLICNTGKKPALDPDKIFQRFYKETTESANTGLGLAIVKAIVELYAFGISYFKKEDHCLQIHFKD